MKKWCFQQASTVTPHKLILGDTPAMPLSAQNAYRGDIDAHVQDRVDSLLTSQMYIQAGLYRFHGCTTGVSDERCCGPLLFSPDYCSHGRSFLLFADAVLISLCGAIAAKQSPAASTRSPART